jgi:hypothetical protein
MVLGVGFIIFAIVLITFLIKRHREKKKELINRKIRKNGQI